MQVSLVEAAGQNLDLIAQLFSDYVVLTLLIFTNDASVCVIGLWSLHHIHCNKEHHLVNIQCFILFKKKKSVHTQYIIHQK